jgi:hypothetical protein
VRHGHRCDSSTGAHPGCAVAPGREGRRPGGCPRSPSPGSSSTTGPGTLFGAFHGARGSRLRPGVLRPNRRAATRGRSSPYCNGIIECLRRVSRSDCRPAGPAGRQRLSCRDMVIAMITVTFSHGIVSERLRVGLRAQRRPGRLGPRRRRIGDWSPLPRRWTASAHRKVMPGHPGGALASQVVTPAMKSTPPWIVSVTVAAGEERTMLLTVASSTTSVIFVS